MNRILLPLILLCLVLTACGGKSRMATDPTAAVRPTTPNSGTPASGSAPQGTPPMGTRPFTNPTTAVVTDPATAATNPAATLGTPTFTIDPIAAQGWRINFSGGLRCDLYNIVGHGANVLTTDSNLCMPSAPFNGAIDGVVYHSGEVVPLTATAAPDFMTPFATLTPENIFANVLGFQVFPRDFVGEQFAWVQAGINQIIFKYMATQAVVIAEPTGGGGGGSGGGNNGLCPDGTPRDPIYGCNGN